MIEEEQVDLIIKKEDIEINLYLLNILINTS